MSTGIRSQTRTIHKAKRSVKDLGLFGGISTFVPPISTSNLYRPDMSTMLSYSRRFLDAHRYTNDGPLVRTLENRLADFHRTKHCVAVANGFWGLVLTMKELALKDRAEVVLPSLTYRRMADVITWAGLTPHFVDVDPRTLAMGPSQVAAGLTPRTGLILGVHPIVNTCDAPGLEALALHHGIPLLFDSVESAAEFVGGKKIGGFGEAECFSLHASKLINGFEGGYITTNNDDLAQTLRMARGFGFWGHDAIHTLGLNAKLNEVHAAMALSCLDELPIQIAHNEEIYRTYELLTDSIAGVRLVRFQEGSPTSYKNILVEITEEWPFTRDETVRLLNAEGVLARAYYNPPLHMKTYTYPTVSSATDLTTQLAQRYILMPSGYRVTTANIVVLFELLKVLRKLAFNGLKAQLASDDSYAR